MKAVFEVEFDPNELFDKESMDAFFDGDWLKLMKAFYKLEGLAIFDNKLELVEVIPDHTYPKRRIEYLIGVTEELETFVRDADALAEDRHQDSFGDSPSYEDTPPHRKHCMLLEKISKLRKFIENVEGGEYETILG